MHMFLIHIHFVDTSGLNRRKHGGVNTANLLQDYQIFWGI